MPLTIPQPAIEAVRNLAYHIAANQVWGKTQGLRQHTYKLALRGVKALVYFGGRVEIASLCIGPIIPPAYPEEHRALATAGITVTTRAQGAGKLTEAYFRNPKRPRNLCGR